MTISIFVWIILVVIGVFDAREHRIPNNLIIILLFFILVDDMFNYHLTQNLDDFEMGLINFFVCLLIGILIYLTGGMAGGDVKLFTVIGLILGQCSVVEYIQLTSWLCIFIGLMYWVLNRAGKKKLYDFNIIKGYFLGCVLGGKLASKSMAFRTDNITHMPFAPVLIIGLAMYQFSLL